ncbi:hypothetical protein AWM75_08405 [Aerococcus urinaehominis]|uniref:Uncharacterized protein n=1 Tax=Aerococcus urinaehominis TaxID=128944 RepID=A0A0X8FMD5_9LACT|nr:hypothetical protein [Aerococcus urinaehominis]AMB99991.1 hypothetical protein AWM75_08405 [Aerococcus urinaehominis]SDL82745.1 hypothetical protein SAMN04487985_101167 [Aerococcus urinaehominis]
MTKLMTPFWFAVKKTLIALVFILLAAMGGILLLALIAMAMNGSVNISLDEEWGTFIVQEILPLVAKLFLIVTPIQVAEYLFDTTIRLSIRRQNYFILISAFTSLMVLGLTLLDSHDLTNNFWLTFFGYLVILFGAQVLVHLVYRTSYLVVMLAVAPVLFIFGFVLGFLQNMSLHSANALANFMHFVTNHNILMMAIIGAILVAILNWQIRTTSIQGKD